jgi:hypothetical protein
MGLCDGNEMRSVIEHMQKNSSVEKCLLLRGINKSAFEIYGDDLKELLVSDIIGAAHNPPRMFNVATWAEGPAALSGGAVLSSLGPVINTDNLHWGRAKPDRQFNATLDMGAIISKVQETVDTEEVADLTTEIVCTFAPCSQLHRRALSVTVANLLGLCKGNDAMSYRLVVTYWGLPWAAAIGLPQECISTAIQKILPDGLTVPTISKALDELTTEPEF